MAWAAKDLKWSSKPTGRIKPISWPIFLAYCRWPPTLGWIRACVARQDRAVPNPGPMFVGDVAICSVPTQGGLWRGLTVIELLQQVMDCGTNCCSCVGAKLGSGLPVCLEQVESSP